jgi:hypothetical protein
VKGAAQVLEHGCVVCTHDKHFGFVEGLISGNSITDLLCRKGLPICQTIQPFSRKRATNELVVKRLRPGWPIDNPLGSERNNF